MNITRKADRASRVKPGRKLIMTCGRLAKRHGCGLGVDPLLAESGCSKGSLYTIYKSKDGLLAATCMVEREELEKTLHSVDPLTKKPKSLINVVTSTVLDAIDSPASLVGVSLSVLMTVFADTSSEGLPLATSAAELTIKSFPKHLRDRLSGVPGLRLSDDFDTVAQEYFKTLLLSAAAPRIFPNEKPWKQAALLLASQRLAAEIKRVPMGNSFFGTKNEGK